MRIALFPLHTVLFPGAPAPLHVFEQRYRTMMQHVLAAELGLGIVAISQGAEVGGHATVYDVGCLTKIEQARHADDDTLIVSAHGTRRFRIEERLPDDPFPLADVEFIDDGPPDANTGAALSSARAALHRYLSVVARLQSEDVIAPTLPNDMTAASFSICSALHLDISDRQHLLECSDASSRLRLATTLARREAILLEAVGPAVGPPSGAHSLN